MQTKIAINGAAGRMGQRLLALACDDPDLEVVQALEYDGHPQIGAALTDIVPGSCDEVTLRATLAAGAKVLVDFSIPKSTVARAQDAAALGIGLVIGTTGMTADEEAAITEAAKTVPVIHAPNYSLGVNVLFKIAGEVAQALGEEFDIEIAESHHNQKADAPSGTALGIAKSICAATGRSMKNDLVHGRQGRPGARRKGEIGMHALRLGSVVGDHTAHFGSTFERVELTHRAETRDVFAAGALRAAKWLAGKPAGLYTMQDVLFGGKQEL